MSKPRIKAGAPKSIEAAGAAAELKNRMEGNGIAKGEKPTVATNEPPGAPTRAEKRRKASERVKPSDVPKQGRMGKEDEGALPGILSGTLDGVGKAGRKLLDAIDAEELAKAEKVDAMANVIRALKKAKRREVKIDGFVITHLHKQACDVVKVKKPSSK